jgi:DNA-binding MarR family transcriptional regulator
MYGTPLKSRPRSRDDIQQHDARSILDSIRRIVQALRVSGRDAEKRVGLSGAQLFVLQKLSGSKALSLNELAHRTLTHQSSVSVVAQRLVERGLVASRTSRQDGRRIELSLTAAGRKALAKSPEAAQDQLIAALARMPRRNRKQLANLLEQLVSATGMSQELPGLFFEESAATKGATQ